VLLRETLKKTGKVGIAKLVIRTRQYLAMLKPHEDALILILLRFPQELIDADEFNLPAGKAAAHRVSERELDMAAQLVDSMSVPWRPEDYKDDFRQRLRKLVEQQVKKQGGRRKAKPAAEAKPEPASNVVDFMSLLQKSVASGKRTAPKKATSGAKKAAAKKSTTARKKPAKRRAGARS